MKIRSRTYTMFTTVLGQYCLVNEDGIWLERDSNTCHVISNLDLYTSGHISQYISGYNGRRSSGESPTQCSTAKYWVSETTMCINSYWLIGMVIAEMALKLSIGHIKGLESNSTILTFYSGGFKRGRGDGGPHLRLGWDKYFKSVNEVHYE